jgi:hypothetical protein
MSIRGPSGIPYRYGFRHLSRSVDENDLPSATARRGCKRDGVSDVPAADDAKLHCSAPILIHRCRRLFRCEIFEIEKARCSLKTVHIFQRAQGPGARGCVISGVGFLGAFKRCLGERVGLHLGIAAWPNVGISAGRADLLLDLRYLRGTGPCIGGKSCAGQRDERQRRQHITKSHHLSLLQKTRPNIRAAPGGNTRYNASAVDKMLAINRTAN